MDDASYENTATNQHMHTLRLGSTKSRLYIDCVSPADIGSYACVAETPYRRIVTRTKLSIGETRVLGVYAINGYPSHHFLKQKMFVLSALNARLAYVNLQTNSSFQLGASL